MLNSPGKKLPAKRTAHLPQDACEGLGSINFRRAGLTAPQSEAEMRAKEFQEWSDSLPREQKPAPGELTLPLLARTLNRLGRPGGPAIMAARERICDCMVAWLNRRFLG